jgi:hypothetical protein
MILAQRPYYPILACHPNLETRPLITAMCTGINLLFDKDGYQAAKSIIKCRLIRKQGKIMSD